MHVYIYIYIPIIPNCSDDYMMIFLMISDEEIHEKLENIQKTLKIHKNH